MLLKGQRLKVLYKVHPVPHEPTSLAGVGCIAFATFPTFTDRMVLLEVAVKSRTLFL